MELVLQICTFPNCISETNYYPTFRTSTYTEYSNTFKSVFFFHWETVLITSINSIFLETANQENSLGYCFV